MEEKTTNNRHQLYLKNKKKEKHRNQLKLNSVHLYSEQKRKTGSINQRAIQPVNSNLHNQWTNNSNNNAKHNYRQSTQKKKKKIETKNQRKRTNNKQTGAVKSSQEKNERKKALSWNHQKMKLKLDVKIEKEKNEKRNFRTSQGITFSTKQEKWTQ